MLGRILKIFSGSSEPYPSMLLNLPNEVIALIFSYVDPVDILQSCSLVCRRFNDIIVSPDFWSDLFVYRYGTQSLINLRASAGSYHIDFKRIVVFLSFERNLILNPSGEFKSEFWEVIADGGNRMVVESFDTLSPPGHGITMTPEELSAVSHPEWLSLPSRFCFATSYGITEKYQVIDLYENGMEPGLIDILKPPIAVGEWVGVRFDCGAEYSLKVSLLGDDNTPLDSFSERIRIAQWQGGSWFPVAYVFTDYPDGVRKIKFEHSGVDTQFWRGHYGAKFCNATVKLLLPSHHNLSSNSQKSDKH